MTRNQQLVKLVKQLVSDSTTAVDVESGLCRYCDQMVEAFDPKQVQPHLAKCPWVRVRELVGAA